MELTLGALEYHIKNHQVHQEKNDRQDAVIAAERLGHDDESCEVSEEALVLGSGCNGIIGGMKVRLVRPCDLHE